MLSDKRNAREQAGDKKSVFLFLVLLIAVAGVAVTVYLRSENITFQDIKLGKIFTAGFSQGEKGLEASVISAIKYEAKENPVFSSYNGNIIQYSNKYLKAINPSGKEQWQLELSMQAPVIKHKGEYLLVADTLGKEVCVIDGSNVKWEAAVEGNITNVDINSQGYVAVVHKTKDYKSAISVFDSAGNKIFTNYMGERYALIAKVFPSGKQVAVNSIDTSGIKAISKIEFLDMFGNSLNEGYSFNDNVYPQTWCFSNGSAVSVNDSSAVCYDKNKQEIWKLEFGKKSLYASGVCMDKYLVVASSANPSAINSSGAAEIQVYGTSGKLLDSYKLDKAVSGMVIHGDIIGVNTGAEVHFINSKGQLMRTYLSKSEIIQLEMLSDDEAAVITKGNIAVVKI